MRSQHATLLLLSALPIDSLARLRSLLYQYVDGSGFFTSHGQPSKQLRLVRYIYERRYNDHHDDEFIRRCERLRRQFILTSALCGLVTLALIGLAIWH